jgi:hypothetical protein
MQQHFKRLLRTSANSRQGSLARLLRNAKTIGPHQYVPQVIQTRFVYLHLRFFLFFIFGLLRSVGEHQYVPNVNYNTIEIFVPVP